MSFFRFPFGSASRAGSRLASRTLPRRRSGVAANGRLSVEQFESRAMLAATITEVNSLLPAQSVYGIGKTITFEVGYSEPVAVTSSPSARLNFFKPDGSRALASYVGPSAGGRVLNFAYVVQPGDQVASFDVMTGSTPAPGFLLGGTIITLSDSTPADRDVGNTVTDPSISTLKPGIAINGISPSAPTVGPTLYVNPTAWQSNPQWSTFHPEYFVLEGTIGANRALTAGEVFRVTVNGATYQSTGATANSPATGFTVNADGSWLIRIRPVGNQPADAPVSGTLAPWSTTEGDAYNVVATLTNAYGNSTSTTSEKQIVIDMTEPSVMQVLSTTPNGSYTVGDVLDVSVMYSEPVRVMGNVGVNPSILINVTNPNSPGTQRSAKFAGIDPLDGRIVHFSYTVQAGDVAPATGVDYLDANSLVIGSGFIEDQAGNTANNTLVAPPGTAATQLSVVGSGSVILLDTTVPILAPAGVTSPAPNGTYYAGGPVIPIQIQFTEPVFVTGSPQLFLSSAAGRFAAYAAGSGTTTLTFNYTVQLGDDTGTVVGATNILQNLDYNSATALQLNGGRIDDIAGNNAVLTLPAPGAAGSLSANKSIAIAAAPVVLAVTTPDTPANYVAGQTIRIWVTFSKVVTVVPGGLIPTLQMAVQSPGTAPIARFVGYVPNTPFPVPATPFNTTTPSSILEFDYVIRPGDFTTAGSWLNYTAGSLTAGAGIRYTWTGASLPSFLDADLSTLPAPSNALANNLPAMQISIVNDSAPPAAPGLALATDTTNAIGIAGADGVTSNATVNVSGLETAVGTTWQYSTNGGVTWSAWFANTATTFTLPSNTTFAINAVQVRQRDTSGNIGSIGANIAQWTVDTVAPLPPASATITETGAAGSGITNNPLVTVTGLEANALLQYCTTYNSTTGSVGTNPTWISVGTIGSTSFSLPAGTYNPSAGTGVVVRQQDLAGNYSPTPPWTVLATNTGGTTITVVVDTTVATPIVALNSDTTPNVGGFNGLPYTGDFVTNSGLVNVTGLEVAGGGASGLAQWQWDNGDGTGWRLGGTTAPAGTLSLPGNPLLPGGAVYATGSFRVRQTDIAGNTSAIWSNPAPWTIDSTAPAIRSLAAPAGNYLAGQTITISVGFGESVYLSGFTPTLTLDTGSTATLITPVTPDTTTLQFAYVVQVGDASNGLTVTSFNLNGATLADRAGNTAGTLVGGPVSGTPSGGVIVAAGIVATAPQLVNSTSLTMAASVRTALPSMQIVFNTPVRNFTLKALKLYWSPSSTGTPTRVMSLTGATLRAVGTSGTNYSLTLPKSVTSAKGTFLLVVDGRLSDIRSTINPATTMKTPSNIYFRRA